jgi:hypothetical protein
MLSIGSVLLFWLSLPYCVTCLTRSGGVVITSGTFGIARQSIHPHGFQMVSNEPRVEWKPAWNSLFIVIPLWIPFLVGLALFGIAWRIDRRPTGPRCDRCGYDLTGNVSGTCPECGSERS